MSVISKAFHSGPRRISCYLSGCVRPANYVESWWSANILGQVLPGWPHFSTAGYVYLHRNGLFRLTLQRIYLGGVELLERARFSICMASAVSRTMLFKIEFVTPQHWTNSRPIPFSVSVSVTGLVIRTFVKLIALKTLVTTL